MRAPSYGTQVCGMRLLDFRLPDFLRVAWVSQAARNYWSPRIQAIQRAWNDIEWQSVARGIRRSAILTVGHSELVELGRTLCAEKLIALPLARVAATPGVYQSRAMEPADDAPFSYRLVVASPDVSLKFMDAWLAGSAADIGHFLGYPRCCRTFFQRTWVDAALIDPTWPMAGGQIGDTSEVRQIDLTARFECNVLARFVGVRAVPHLPCRFSCPESGSFGSALLELGDELGFTGEMADLKEILNWSFEWSALHGVAEVRTPVMKVAVATDATAECHVVRLHGQAFPKHGARGHRFPYGSPARSFEPSRVPAPLVTISSLEVSSEGKDGSDQG